MTPQKSPTLPKPTLPPFWKWLTRVTAAIALTLFLVPTVFVVKYYVIDKPAEDAYRTDVSRTEGVPVSHPIALSYWETLAQKGDSSQQTDALHHIGRILHSPGINYRYPLECLAAKATLADLAIHDKNPPVRAAASEELGKVAQSGAVIRR